VQLDEAFADVEPEAEAGVVLARVGDLVESKPL
jgi:hypothetical protein